MTRRTWVFWQGQVYEKGTEPKIEQFSVAPAFIPDAPDFISPIDHTVVKGNAGIRDHCARHNVVPTRELAGLPHSVPHSEPDRNQRREDIRRVMQQKGYL